MASALIPRQSSPPVLAMLVDRTSFDETDSFQVDREALESSDRWSDASGANHQDNHSQQNHHDRVVMRNGKVRRKLRWRPKGMEKQKRSPQHPPLPPTGSSLLIGNPLAGKSIMMKRNPSNGSVTGSITSMSTISQSSRTSKRSQHSFASTETQVQSNTRKSLRFPLPRPNYPSRLDGASASNQMTTIEDVPERVYSVGAGRNSPLFASADLEEKKEDAAETASQASGTSSNGGTFSPSRKSGFPPIFKKKASRRDLLKRTNSQGSMDGSRTPPLSPPPLSVISHSTAPDRVSPILAQPSPGSPLPRLSGEEVEQERRVDLRIRRGRSDTDQSPQPFSSSGSVGGESVSIAELRAANGPWPDLLPSRPPLPPSARRVPTPARGSSSTSCTIASSSAITANDTHGGPVVTHARSNSALAASTDASTAGVMHGVTSLAFETSNTMSEQYPIEVDEDDEEELMQTLPVVNEDEQELRFSMSHRTPSSVSTKGSSNLTRMSSLTAPMRRLRSNAASTSSKMDEEDRVEFVHTSSTPAPTFPKAESPKSHVPVDMDDCSFLQAEKNLQAIHDMATEHLQQGEYDEALEVFEEILRGQLARYGPDHYRVGIAHHNIGIVHMRREDYEQATRSYLEAVKVRKKALAPDHPDVAVSQAQLGVAYLERSMHKKAISAFREALRIRRRCLGPNHPKVAKILNNIGCALYELNELDVSRVAFEEALNIQRQNLRDLPVESMDVSNHSLLSIASTLSNIGSIKLYMGMYDEASVDLEEALLIQQCVFGDNHPIPKQTEDSLKWIEDSQSVFHGLPVASAMDILSHLTGSLSMRSSGADDSSGVFSCASPSETLSHVSSQASGPLLLTNNVLDSFERRFVKLQDRLETACGNDNSDEERPVNTRKSGQRPTRVHV